VDIHVTGWFCRYTLADYHYFSIKLTGVTMC
jgi:hypothetical protein